MSAWMASAGAIWLLGVASFLSTDYDTNPISLPLAAAVLGLGPLTGGPDFLTLAIMAMICPAIYLVLTSRLTPMKVVSLMVV